MKIHVRWEDIRDGQSAKTMECMVALALKRELGVRYASVGYGDATILAEGECVRIYLPRKVGNKIRFWDRFHLMLPFSFELSPLGLLTGPRLQNGSHFGADRAVHQGELLEAHA